MLRSGIVITVKITPKAKGVKGIDLPGLEFFVANRVSAKTEPLLLLLRVSEATAIYPLPFYRKSGAETTR